MSGSRTVSRARWLALSLAFALLWTSLSPVAATLAATDLVSGDAAIVVNTGSDLIRMRSKPGLNGAVVGEYSEGTPVDVIDGPQISDDGEAWYRVAIEGKVGYMAAEFLAAAGSEAPAEEPQTAPETELDEPSDDPVVAAEVIRNATIVNSGGDAIRCRAEPSTESEVLGYFNEGDTVELSGEADGDWQSVVCEGQIGWMHTDYLSSTADPEAAPTPEEDVVTVAAVATIANTGGSGVRCRAKPSTDAAVITVLEEGSSVSLRGAKKNGWYPVTCAGRKGHVWAEFVSASSSSGGNGNEVTGSGVIANTNGDGVRCRKKASFEGAVLMVLREGDEVQLRGAQRGDWQPIFCGGKKGFVHADYVEAGGSGGGGGWSGWKAGDVGQVEGTSGQGVRLRSAANTSASVVMVLSEGTKVDVRSGSTGDWVAVTFRGSKGFVHDDYMVKADAGSGDGGSSGSLSEGDHAKVTERLNFRTAANSSSSVQGVAAEGIVVLVTGGKENGFFPVEWAGIAGYMHGDYLAWTDAPLSEGSSGVGGDAGDGSPSATGRAMVDYAMDYIGYPYVWATAGPNSFDCSGFTYWVTKHVLGDDIGRGLWTQVVAGSPVSYGSLKPGDLVFFQNTYTWGLSHVGIYIGDNQFIHAENEETGVRISSITSNYYSTRYYGAVRLG